MCVGNNLVCARLLIDCGADVHAVDENRMTVLRHATTSCAQLLIACGAAAD